PLAAAKAQAQLALHQLSERRAEAGAVQALRVISHQIDHLARLVGDVLDVNQLESGLLELQPSDFDLTALLEEAVARLQPAPGEHPIRLEAPKPLPMLADRDRIDQ